MPSVSKFVYPDRPDRIAYLDDARVFDWGYLLEAGIPFRKSYSKKRILFV
jgi:hypothetical protein